MTHRGHATGNGAATDARPIRQDLFDIVPLQDVRPLGGDWWEATGPNPAFRIAAPAGATALPAGWVQLTATIAAPDPLAGIARLHFDRGEGFSDADRLPLFRHADGRLGGVVPLPPGLRALRLDPLDRAGPFRLGRVRLRRLARPDAAARLLLAYLRRMAADRPGLREALREAVALWRGSGFGAVRRHVATSLMAFEGPAAATAGPVPAANADLYAQWIADNEPPIRRTVAAAGTAPRLSLLLVAEPGREAALGRTLASLTAQSFGAWECLVRRDAASGALPADRRFLAHEGAPTDRATALAALADAATGEHLAVLRPGDVLPPTALQEVAEGLAATPPADILYTDEDLLPPGGARRDPALKPEWSPELLTAYDYFGSLTLLRRGLVAEAGGFAPAMGPAAEWDLHLRAASAARHIRRLPRILCHRDPANRPDRAGDASNREAIRAHWARRAIEARIETQPDGTQRSIWDIAQPPLVSLIIPVGDKPVAEPDGLQGWLEGLLRQTAYPRLEVILVGDPHPAPASGAPSETPAGAAPGCGVLVADHRVRLMRCAAPPGRPAAWNAGARAARGELLLFLGRGLEATDPDWLAELVRFAQRPGVGVVGARVLDPAGSVAHGGVVLGLPLCGAAFRGAAPNEGGPFGSAGVPRNWLAVAGGCQMVRREVFDEVGGFSEDYRASHADIALALRAWRAGWRIASTPFATLVDRAAADPPATDRDGADGGGADGGGADGGGADPADQARLAAEIRAMGLTDDPYWHPGLSALRGTPTLRVGAAPDAAESLRQETEGHLAAYPAPTGLDLFDDLAAAAAAGLPREAILWPPLRDIDDAWAAARWCIDLLRRREDLRARFPRALSDGAEGGFARWLQAEGRATLHLDDVACGHLRACFASAPAARVRQAVLVAPEVLAAIPLGFTPAGRHDLARWLFRTGRGTHRLRDEEVWWFLLECAEDPARELVRTYLFTPEWQRLFPDGLTMFGRRALGRWLTLSYRIEGGWTDPASWPPEHSPAEQIRLAWHARDAWRRRFPAALRDPAVAAALLAWLAGPEAAPHEEAPGAAPGAAAGPSPGAGLPEEVRAWCAALPPGETAAALAAPGVTVIGHFCYPSGLRTSVLSLTEGLRAAGCGVALRDVPVDLLHDEPRRAGCTGLEPFGTTLIHVQPEPYFARAFALAGLQERRPRTHRIGYWYWEIDEVPAEWAAAAALVDELWAATGFVADALRARFARPVHILPPGVRLAPFARRPRSHFGVPEGKHAFLFAFHTMSIMERKNPLGLIRAFRLAFGPQDAAVLVLKTTFGENHPAPMRALRQAAAAAGAEVMIIDQVLTREETLSLMDCCDAYVSLHRSEGFGLTMAEAMLLGKPAIATGYSGNTDFMDDSNSLLVQYGLVRLQRAVPPYAAGQHWAEPDEAHAAALLRRVFDQPAWARALGERARRDLGTRMSVEAAGRRMAERLEAIRRLAEDGPPG